MDCGTDRLTKSGVTVGVALIFKVDRSGLFIINDIEKTKGY